MLNARLNAVFHDVFANLRYAGRVLRKRPGFTAIVVLILGLGIGSVTLLFSIVNAVLLRSLPFRDSDQLIMVWQNHQERGIDKQGFSIPGYFDLEEQQTTLAEVAAYRYWRWSMSAPERRPEQVIGAEVSHGFFSMLGVEPFLGRGFLPEEDQPGHEGAVILDYHFWRSRFGGDPDIVGQRIKMDETAYRVAGVLGKDFVNPTGRHEVCWLTLRGDRATATRRIRDIRVFGRLHPDTPVALVREELDRYMRDLEEKFPEFNRGCRAYVVSLKEYRVEDSRRGLLMLLAAVAAVLLVAGTNVAGLMLTRTLERRREVAIRLALGSSTARLAGLLLLEAMVLALVAGVLGLALAWAGVQILPAVAPENLPRLEEIQVDATVAAFGFGVALLVGILFSLAPTLKAADLKVQTSLREDSVTTTAGAGRQLLRRVLVASEIALSVVLLICASLVVRSYVSLQRVDLGFEPRNLLTMDLTLPVTRYPAGESSLEWPTLANFRQRLFEQLATVPGVERFSIAIQHPMRRGWEIPVTFDERPAAPGEEEKFILRSVGADYFPTAGIRMLRGRNFAAHEDRAEAPPVVIINRVLAQRYYQDDPVGQRLTFWNVSREIVGVVDNVRFEGPGTDPLPAVYAPFLQAPIPWFSILLQTAVEPGSLVREAQEAVWSIDPELAVSNIRPLAELVAESIAEPRFHMLLLLSFAALALCLTLVGLYGLMAQSVAARRGEIGIRMAFGATPASILRLILKEGALLLAIGLGGGVIMAIGVTRLLGSLLFGVQPTDLPAFISMPLLLAVVGLLACLLPAVRAAKMDPIASLPRCN